MPQSFSSLRKELRRDRRKKERRYGKPDTRVFQYDRRHGERRVAEESSDDELLLIEDDMIIEIHELADELAALSARGPSTSELTQIRHVKDL